jgi:hypothetical protein
VGLITIIEKEWLSFGHQFDYRNGTGVVNSDRNGHTSVPGWNTHGRVKHRDERTSSACCAVLFDSFFF